MINWIIKIYRANPYRPHCTNTTHVWLCEFLHFNGTNDAIPYRSRCPAKDN